MDLFEYLYSDDLQEFIKKSLYILLCIIDIEAHAKGCRKTKMIMEWLSAVMSSANANICICQYIGDIARVMMYEEEGEHSESKICLQRTDQADGRRKFANLLESIFREFSFVFFYRSKTPN